MTIEPEVDNISDLLLSLPEKVIFILRESGFIAKKYSKKIFLVGGMVRDLFLKKKNNDIDLIVDGEIIEITKELAESFGAEWTYNDKFKTANIKLASGYNIDLASCRRERYKYPGALPEIETGNVLEDLLRRDYTVNTLALAIYPQEWGRLYDFFKARDDIKTGTLRVLHRYSFLDDPTRIIRGIRLASKINFSFEEKTRTYINEALHRGRYSALSYYRVLKEIKLLFKERINSKLFNFIKEFPIFKLININLDLNEKYLLLLDDTEVYLEYLYKNNYNIKEWLLRLAILMQNNSKSEINGLKLNSYEERVICFLRTNFYSYYRLNKTSDPVEIVEILDGTLPEEIILLLIMIKSERAKKNIKKYISDLSKIKLAINGFDLQELGLKPGPEIKTVLDKVRAFKLRKIDITKEDELLIAKKIINQIDWSEK